MGKKSASVEMIEKVETCICTKFQKPELVNPSRIARRCRIDHNQAEAALESTAPHMGEPGLWKICREKHELIRSSTHTREWWYACNFSPMTHIIKYFEERILEDFGLSVPPISEASKKLDMGIEIVENLQSIIEENPSVSKLPKLFITKRVQ